MTESQLTKYFRRQVEGTEVTNSSWNNAESSQRRKWLRKIPGTKFQVAGVGPKNLTQSELNDMSNNIWSQLTPFVQNELQQIGESTAIEKLSVLDKFENGFNTPNRCVDCGLSRKAHDKGGIGHPFKTRKQARSNSLEVSDDRMKEEIRRNIRQVSDSEFKRFKDVMDINNNSPIDQVISQFDLWDQAPPGGAEVRGAKDWDNLSRGDQDKVQNILDGFFEDNLDAFPELSPNDMQTVGKKWSQLKPSVKDAILTGGAQFSGVEISRADALLKDFQRQFGADAPQDAEGALDFLRRNGIPRDEAVRTIQAMGGAIENFGSEVEQAQVSMFLDALRDSGVTNMFGAGTFIEKEFGISKQEARNFLTTWMRNFGKESSFYNYDGAEKLDSREDDTDDFVQGMMGIRAKMQKKFKGKTKKELEDMGIFGLGELKATEIKAEQVWEDTDQKTRGKWLENINANPEIANRDWGGLAGSMQRDLRDMFHANDMSVETKKPIGALSPKKISRLRSRMTPDEREDAGEFYQYESVVIKKKASEINQSQWDSANHSTRKRWVHKHVQGVFMIEEDDVANLSWRELDSRIKQELKEQENLSTEFMDHGLRRKIEASEELVSWGLKAGSGRGAASQVQQVVPIVGGTMKAALMNTEDGEWSFIADFKKPNDAKIFRDSLKDTAAADGWINIK